MPSAGVEQSRRTYGKHLTPDLCRKNLGRNFRHTCRHPPHKSSKINEGEREDGKKERWKRKIKNGGVEGEKRKS
jgi:hypothetical protein